MLHSRDDSIAAGLTRAIASGGQVVVDHEPENGDAIAPAGCCRRVPPCPLVGAVLVVSADAVSSVLVVGR